MVTGRLIEVGRLIGGSSEINIRSFKTVTLFQYKIA